MTGDDRTPQEPQYVTAHWCAACEPAKTKLRAALASAQAEIADILLKDRGKTREINILTKENRDQAAALTEAQAEIASLRASLDEQATATTEAMDKWRKWAERAKAAEAALAEATRRQEALGPYLQHARECAKTPRWVEDGKAYEACTCGLAALLAGPPAPETRHVEMVEQVDPTTGERVCRNRIPPETGQ